MNESATANIENGSVRKVARLLDLDIPVLVLNAGEGRGGLNGK